MGWVVLVLGLGFVSAADANTPVAKSPKFSRENPCTYASNSTVKRAFELPVTGTVREGKVLCYLELGPDPDVAPNGRLAVVEEFPRSSILPTATLHYEDKRALEELSEFELVDVFEVGRAAYANRTTSALTVLAGKKFAFTLSWLPAAGTVLTPGEVTSRLERVARDVIARERLSRARA